MIKIDNIDKWYGDFHVLKGCSLEVERGEVIVICGPSGSGKSTLIKCVNALEPVDTGRILVDGTDVTAKGTKLPLVRARIGMVFQHFELFPHKTVIENLMLGQIKVLNRSRDAAREKAESLLERVGLVDQAEKYPVALSGGQQQRVAIARALAMDPIAMCFDEPTSALDPEMMVVTHEMGFARKVARRVVFMDEGEVKEIAETETFFKNPETDRAKEFLSKILAH